MTPQEQVLVAAEATTQTTTQTTTATTTETTTTTTTMTTADEQTETTVTTTTTVVEEQDATTVSALEAALRDGRYAFVPQFGGQGLHYWDELQNLYAKFDTGTARALIAQAADALYAESVSEEATASPAYAGALELSKWLAADEAELETVAWQRAPLSYPLIALTQLANYAAFLDTTGVDHASVVQSSAAAVGHSQGVVSAAVFAGAKTTDEFVQLAVHALRYMYWHGLRAQETFLALTAKFPQNLKRVGDATPMLTVRGLTKPQVAKAIEVANRRTGQEDVQLSLINASNMFCVTGMPMTLALLKKSLEGLLAPADANQTRVPHSDRKPAGAISFLPVSCPFHSVVMADAKAQILSDVERIQLSLPGQQLQVPVYATSAKATNLQTLGDKSVLEALVDMQLTLTADWTATWASIAQHHANVTHVLEFGPATGAAKLSNTIAEGLGIKVVLATIKHDVVTGTLRTAPLEGLTQFLDGAASEASAEQSWVSEFGPRVSNDGKLVNKFTCVLNKPPVVVAGMTPTTSFNGIDLVAAVQNAGFYGELAAGGLSRPNIFEEKVSELASKIKSGVGISINMLYLNAKQWGFQFPMVLRMRRAGVPIESITIGAGIPTTERAVEMMRELQAAGINLIAFKPGSVDGIYAVLEIASALPTMNVMLQWTGGRAGGHHSFEDFHHPLELTYAAIRRVKNVVLVVGSGFGNWEDSHAYLTGEWSLVRGHLAKMPADGILLASRVMAAKEAATATEVKQLLVDTPGIESELDWEQTYKGAAGGIITVNSELGEPIHNVANRCGLLWKEFDDKYFSKPRDQIELAVRLDKDAIIARLNADFQKPYFGRKTDVESGETVVAELEEMTYADVLSRMVELMFVDIENRPRRWLHESFRDRVAKFLTRTEERFHRGGSAVAFDQSGLAAEPKAVLKAFADKYPQVSSTLISVADRDFFLDLCRTGGKPVNFVPVVDGELKTWFKKDSLWYSEDLDAVPQRDAQRVCILQGPVAVRYIKSVDEPVGEILGNIASGFVKVVSDASGSDAAVAETVKTIPASIAGVDVVVADDGSAQVVVPTEAPLPAADAWVDALVELASGKQPWLSALLSSKSVVDGGKWVANPVRALLQPQVHQAVVVDAAGLHIRDSSLSLEEPVIDIVRCAEDESISVIVREVRPATADLSASVVPLTLTFAYHPELTVPIVAEPGAALIDKIKAFYARFWVAKEGEEDASCAAACDTSVLSTFTSEFTVSAEDVATYNAALGLDAGAAGAPADFSTIASWRPLIQSVFTKEVRGNLLDLVHLKHSYKLLSSSEDATKSDKRQLFFPGDELVSSSSVSSLRIIDSGKIVSGVAIISRKTVNDQMVEVLEPLVELRSEFLIRGAFEDFESTFAIESSTHAFTLARVDAAKILESKPWLKFSAKVEVGDALEFRVTTKKQFASTTKLRLIEVTGALLRKTPESDVEVATVEFSSTTANDSPVLAYLRQTDQESADATSAIFPTGGYNMLETPLAINVPENALAYAVASRDLNPIHRSPYAAILAKLPHGKPIMHGLWTATKVRDLVVATLGDGRDSNVVDYDVNFDGMVYPGDSLFMQARHIGLDNGRKVVSVEVVNASGERVVSARALVNEPAIAFVFTGQGSAEVGMGMERYQESPVARDIWDRGDAHLRKTFGFSILEMVRKNPKSITVHFGGKKGRAIRANYMRLTCEDPTTGEIGPLLPEINSRTQSFSFSAPEGLLFATQFSQPALVLLEKATFSEIQVAQLIPEDALFAGHSLGEYAGLSSFAGALAVEDVVEVVFLRGLIMQKAVKRDAAGRSDYGMVAANPMRVGEHFPESALYRVVDGIEAASGKLLQVVNFNVQSLQYVVAGENVNLEALSLTLTAIKTNGRKALADVEAVIAESLTQARARKDKCTQTGKPFTLARGLATIPLVGIDVPFHSKELLSGVPSFRALLRTKFDPEVLDRQLHLLVDRYVPNLVAEPFTLEREYFQRVYNVTKSPYIAEVLDPMQWQLTPRAQLAHLLVVELLAYQFASPVQWIKTQQLLFSRNGTGVRRFVEIGPAPTLTNMAQRTLQVGDFPDTPREILFYQRDRDVVHFENENTNPSASEFARAVKAKAEAEGAAKKKAEEPAVEVSVEAPVAAAPLAVAAPVVAAAPVAAAPVAAAAPVEDAPVAALHVLRVLLSVRLNKPLAEIKEDTDVKTLSAGKSAVQNEILGDLEKEFGSGVPEGAGEVPLRDLAAKFPGYNALGKVVSALVSKTYSSKMPGGFTMSSVKEYLSGPKALGPGRVDSVLAHSLTLAPAARFKSETDARKWLDECVDSYASFAGVSLAPRAPAGMPAGGAMMGSFNPAPVSIPTVADAQVDAKHALLVMLASKFGKSLSEVPETATIKELAAGKSAVQNEIVGDLEKEFGSGPDDAAEMKLSELASKFPGYASPGKVTSALIAKMLASKMPGGFGLSAVKEHLSTERCLPAGRVESVLLHALTQNPKQRFADDAQAKQWLDGVVDDYAKFCGIDIPYLSKLGGLMAMGGGAMGGMSAAPSLPTDFEKRLKTMIADQAAALSEYLGEDQLDWHRKVETEVELREELEGTVSEWVAEHGEFYGNGIHSLFDANKERQYDSYWNWAVQDAMELYYKTIGVKEISELPGNKSLDAHFDAMSRWINKQVETLNEESSRPPLAWFKPFLCNRATPELLQCTKYFVQRAKEEGGAEYSQAIQLLVEQVEEWLHLIPVNMQVFQPTQPQLTILEDGKMDYAEVPREGVADSIDYVDELARGLEYNDPTETMRFREEPTRAEMASAVGFESTMNVDGSISEGDDEEDDESDSDEATTAATKTAAALDSKTESVAQGPKLNALRESLRKRVKKPSSPTDADKQRRQSLVARASTLRVGLNENLKQIVLPHVHVRKPSDVDPTIRLYDVEATCLLLSCMREMASAGISFAGKVALVTGCGRNSIGAELVKALLEGGATVFVTTSSFNPSTTAAFRAIYEQHGSRGSRLFVVPFNQASKLDVQRLVSHIYATHGLDLDFVIPFAALSEVGRTITDIDSRSELAHRIMLTNTVRLLGEVVTAKKARGISTRPALAVLPMSPNHGNFGGDGLYAESKLGVESLMNKWSSEGWDEQLSIVGAVIGWTRGTGLMSGNNVVAAGVEKLGMRTFSTTEMGFNLSALLHPSIVDRAAEAPIWADLTGGMAQVTDLQKTVEGVRANILSEAKLQASVHAARQSEEAASDAKAAAKKPLAPRANLSGYYGDSFPELSTARKLVEQKSSQSPVQLPHELLRGMLDLRQIVVVAGFGEVGPWGNARTRWEMESYGQFSIEGCIELAWLTGHIVFEGGNWVDAKTKEVVPDHEVKAKYEETLLQHAGIRIVEPELFDGYDPYHKMMLHQVAIDKKMSPIEVADREEALQFRSELGADNIDIFQSSATGAWMIRLRKGAVLNIPRALAFDRFVAGQIPTGWSAERLGVPKDLADSVDPITLYVLASTMDAFVAAGVTDPYEFYQYVHVAEVGNTSGGGMGGMRAFKRIYQNRFQGKSVPSDTLQECFINTAPAWVNMLLLSASGPIKTPVGACATAAESVDVGVETIKSGKARVVIVGGYDDFGEEGAYEFAQMKATSDSVKEFGMGRVPQEMCRPCSTTRGGFMESHGAGMQLLMDAQLALDMGVPIYGVVALTNTATDKNGRSVPAPGQGILTTARESSTVASPLLDISFRRRQFDSELASIEAWFEREKALMPASESADDNAQALAFIEDMKARKVQSAQALWGVEFFHGRTDIAPLRGALSVWNLTIDDLGVASFHGTGTMANDKNESEVTHKQLQHLGRSQGNPLPVVCQKNLTGHPKGAAAAWMLNGLLQVLNTGLIPGNRNLDNTDPLLRKFDYLMYPNRSFQTAGVKAALLKSFGFGQAGGEVLLVHADCLLSTLAPEEFASYAARREKRRTRMNTYAQGALAGKHTYIQVKDSAPYSAAQESHVYLDPTARAEFDVAANTWRFAGADSLAASESRRQRAAAKRAAKKAKHQQAQSPQEPSQPQSGADGAATLLSAVQRAADDVNVGLRGQQRIGVGVDVEPIATFEQLHGREDFIRRNFTDQEMAYCYGAPHPASSFAGRWAAKEAVIKAISSATPDEPNAWKGAGAPLREIEIFMTASGAPSVLLSGHPLEVFNRTGLASLSVSISHSGDFAVAQAVASFDQQSAASN